MVNSVYCRNREWWEWSVCFLLLPGAPGERTPANIGLPARYRFLQAFYQRYRYRQTVMGQYWAFTGLLYMIYTICAVKIICTGPVLGIYTLWVAIFYRQTVMGQYWAFTGLLYMIYTICAVKVICTGPVLGIYTLWVAIF